MAAFVPDVETYITQSIQFLQKCVNDGIHTDVLLAHCVERADDLFRYIVSRPGDLPIDTSLVQKLIEVNDHLVRIKKNMMLSIVDLDAKKCTLQAVINADYEEFFTALRKFHNLSGMPEINNRDDVDVHNSQMNGGFPQKLTRLIGLVSHAIETDINVISTNYYSQEEIPGFPYTRAKIQKYTLLLNALCAQIYNVKAAKSNEPPPAFVQLPEAIANTININIGRVVVRADNTAVNIITTLDRVADTTHQIMTGFYGICSAIIGGGAAAANTAFTIAGLVMDIGEGILRHAHGKHSYFSESETDSSSVGSSSSISSGKTAAINDLMSHNSKRGRDSDTRSNKSEIFYHMPLLSERSVTSISKSSAKFRELIGKDADDNSTIKSEVSKSVNGARSPEFLAFSSLPFAEVTVRASAEEEEKVGIAWHDVYTKDHEAYLNSIKTRFGILGAEVANSDNNNMLIDNGVFSFPNSAVKQLTVADLEQVANDFWDITHSRGDIDSDGKLTLNEANVITSSDPPQSGDSSIVDDIPSAVDNTKNFDAELIALLLLPYPEAESVCKLGFVGDGKTVVDVDSQVSLDPNDFSDNELGGGSKPRRNKRSIKKRANKKARTTRRKRATKKRRALKKRRTTRKR